MSDAEKVAAFTLTLRTAIAALARTHGLHEQPHIVYSAISYELAAVIAKNSDSLADAHFSIAEITRTMKDQVNRFGVGKWHP